VLALSAEHGANEWSPWATVVRGWAMAMQGRHAEGIPRIREGQAVARATLLGLWRPYTFGMLAEANIEAGHFNDAHDASTEALAVADEHQELWPVPELYRLRGELLLKQDASNAAQAEQSLRTAIDIARRQKAKSWELRATTSLARLLDKQGHRDEARAMLAKIYNWFTEGFSTADLKAAKALLDALSA
jgi:predicted ATPase